MHPRPRESRAPLGLNMANMEGHLRDFSSFSPMGWSSHFMEQPWRLVGVQLKKACLECGRGRMLDVPARGAGFNVLVGRHGRAGQTQENARANTFQFFTKIVQFGTNGLKFEQNARKFTEGSNPHGFNVLAEGYGFGVDLCREMQTKSPGFAWPNHTKPKPSANTLSHTARRTCGWAWRWKGPRRLWWPQCRI
jgi:hypothetical protein